MNAPRVHPGDILAGRYRVERVLGEGGMGVVVAATDLEQRTLRAIKLISPSVVGDASAVKRLLGEARAAARLKGEHVARIHDVGHLDNGVPFLVMEHLDGRDLRAELAARGKLPVGEALTIVLQVCEALAEAHAGGVVHRDLKPANLFLVKRPPGGRPPTFVKVLDFGVAKVPADADGAGTGNDDQTAVTAVTETGILLGSPHYMSPEQMQSSRGVDGRADVWSLGVIAYQLLTGHLPFEGDGLAQVATAILEGNPAPPSSLVPGLPPALDAAVLACLVVEPSDRCASVVELTASLAPFAPRDAAPSLERLIGLPQRTRSRPPRPRRFSAALWVAGAAIALALGGTLAFLLFRL